MSQDAIKKVKKGEVLFKENDVIPNIYVVQTGKMSLTVERGGKKIEVGQIGPYQILGEQSVISNAKQLCGAEALQETKVVEMSVDGIKALYEKSPANFKLFVRGLLEEAKQARIAMRTNRMENDKSPCPQMAIPRVFTLTHIIPRHIGKRDPNDPNKVTVAWMAFKNYANRNFGEPPTRLRSLMDLLLKLKIAEFQVRTNEEGEEELTDLHISSLQQMEDFAEFYQYHLFKGGKSEAIYVDATALKVVKGLVEFSEGLPVDHRGATSVDYNHVIAKFKEKYRMDFKPMHLDLLEKKGFFAQRKAPENAPVILYFDRAEAVRLSFYWALILEIDKWNDKGFVDLNEKEEVLAADGNACPQCSGPITKENKFCPNCGFKLAQAA